MNTKQDKHTRPKINRNKVAQNVKWICMWKCFSIHINEQTLPFMFSRRFYPSRWTQCSKSVHHTAKWTSTLSWHLMCQQITCTGRSSQSLWLINYPSLLWLFLTNACWEQARLWSAVWKENIIVTLGDVRNACRSFQPHHKISSYYS